jgi:hypothetical protein
LTAYWRAGKVTVRQLEPRHDRVDHRVARRAEFLGGGPQEPRAIERRVGVQRRAEGLERGRPRLRRPDDSHSARASGATVWVQKAPVGVERSSVRRRRTRAAS